METLNRSSDKNGIIGQTSKHLHKSGFGFEGGMWDLIVLVPDQRRSFYF